MRRMLLVGMLAGVGCAAGGLEPGAPEPTEQCGGFLSAPYFTADNCRQEAAHGGLTVVVGGADGAAATLSVSGRAGRRDLGAGEGTLSFAAGGARCEAFDGEVLWLTSLPSWELSVNARCRSDASLRVAGRLSGYLTE